MSNSITPQTTVQLTNEEIARVFAVYLGCQCRNGGTLTHSLITHCLAAPFGFANTQMALTPLSKISDEDAIEVAKFHIPIFGGLEIPKGSDFEKQAIREGKKSVLYCYSAVLFQYLIQKGYAVPLFFGVNHPLNGKTAIELNLAIDKTKP